MLDKVSQVAEQVATNVSRREFLGRFGRGAMAAASAVAGILALPAIGDAAKPPPVVCDGYSYSGCIGKPVGSTCFGSFGISGTCRLVEKKTTTCGCY